MTTAEAGFKVGRTMRSVLLQWWKFGLDGSGSETIVGTRSRGRGASAVAAAGVGLSEKALRSKPQKSPLPVRRCSSYCNTSCQTVEVSHRLTCQSWNRT